MPAIESGYFVVIGVRYFLYGRKKTPVSTPVAENYSSDAASVRYTGHPSVIFPGEKVQRAPTGAIEMGAMGYSREL